MASALHDSLPYLPQGTIICPIPTAPTRVRQRGFDQAVLIAQHLARQRDLACRFLLRRQTNTRQLGQLRKKRFSQMQQAFYIPRSADIMGKTVLLVDDVFTTGATIAATTTMLRNAGASEVYAAVFAQKI